MTDSDSAGVYYMSVEDFEARPPEACWLRRWIRPLLLVLITAHILASIGGYSGKAKMALTQ